jgi:hypothetical protein
MESRAAGVVAQRGHEHALVSGERQQAVLPARQMSRHAANESDAPGYGHEPTL